MYKPTDNEGRVLGTVAIETHGCKLNQADSEVLARRFAQVGYSVVNSDEPADIYIVNTCTVTHQADRKARQALGAARRLNPLATLVATGCYAQRAPQQLSGQGIVDLVAGNSQKDRLVELVLAARGDPIVTCAVGEEAPAWPGAFGRTRSMVKIQEGCNQVCSYCIVPKVRGRERSIPPEVLLGQASRRVEEGFKEIVLTGTQLGSYGFDLEGIDLAELIELILANSGLQRLRISSLQPQEITSRLLRLWSDPRLCPHFHMPLQSGSTSILKRMHRRYTPAQYADSVERIQTEVSGVAITADVIVGFPGEGPAQFQESLEFCRAVPLAGMHVFPYSVRPGTGAAHMRPQVEEREKRGRMSEMLALAEQKSALFRESQVGAVRPVLWEGPRVRQGHTVGVGLTDNYLRVYTEENSALTNQITPAILLQHDGTLYARVIGTEGNVAQPRPRVESRLFP